VRVVLVRHGETEHNRGQLTLGRADVPLNDRGRLQAAAIAASFTRRPAAVYSSPLGRCRETADAIAVATSSKVIVEPELIEMDVGEMEHLTREELRQRHPEFLRLWMEDPSTVRMPGGETLEEVQDRAWGFLERVSGEFRSGGESGDVVAVTHNFVILTLVCRTLGLPLAGMRRFRAGVGSRTELEMGPAGAALILVNDAGHLQRAGLG
jgi:broad specificity phosphatase PhoE